MRRNTGKPGLQGKPALPAGSPTTLPTRSAASAPSDLASNNALPGHLLSTLALSRRWQVSTRTLQRWRALSIGPTWLCLGRRVLYRLADIEAHEVAARRNAASSARGRVTAP